MKVTNNQRESDRSASSAEQRRALLVGIRTYPNIPPAYGKPLTGCHNDVANMREVLLGKGFSAANIRVLLDRMESGCDCVFCQSAAPAEPGSPTRQGIISAVQELTQAVAWDDIVTFYYSGHGSEFSGRGLNAGQRFQTIVPHDSGRAGAENRDITDREIEGWIRDLTSRTPYVTMIFDSCHSGGVTDLRGQAPVGRQVRADERTAAAAFAPQLGTILKPETADDGQSAPEAKASKGQTGWLRGTGSSAIVLSASAAKEYSTETKVDGKKQGLFTYHLTQTLADPGTAEQTWAEIFPAIAAAVTAENLSQHPRREGSSLIFGQGPIAVDDVYPPDVVELRKLAIVIGIDYQRPQDTADQSRSDFPPLTTPRDDAVEVARVLEELQGYEIVGISSRHPGPLLNEMATRKAIHQVIDRLIRVKARTKRETAVLIYFAGHGVVRTESKGEHVGYLVPWEGDQNDPTTWLPMQDLRDHLVDGIWGKQRLARLGHKRGLKRLTSRHLLLVLDCCFGGSLAFDFFRGSDSPDRPIYYSEYKRFVEGSAWQLLTSTSYNQQAMDRSPSDSGGRHSPFAGALLEGLTSDHADTFHSGSRSDQIITASELHQFIDSRLQQLAVDIQTPGLMALRPLRGQFIFQVPGFRPTPLPDPPLDSGANPWRGELEYDEPGAEVPEYLFCGRERALLELLDLFLGPRLPRTEPQAGSRTRPAVAVAGATASGKTSLVRAGLLPLLANPVPARRSLRSWLFRQQEKHMLVEAEDLTKVREWARKLALYDLLDDPQGLSQKVRQWANDAGLLVDGEPRAAQLQAQTEMASLGIPNFEEGSAQVERGWLSRLGLLRLEPQQLAERLRFWLAEGGLADFLSREDKDLATLVGRWQVVNGLAEMTPPADADDLDVLLVLDDLQTWGDDNGERWQAFAASQRTRTVATVSSASLQQDPSLLAAADRHRPLWQLYHLPAPTRAELREIVCGPAANKALVFTPSELVDSLLEEVRNTPAPLWQLSLTLSEMYKRALQRWQLSQDADRQLCASDHEPMAVARLLAGQAETIYSGAKDNQARDKLISLLLRTVSFDDQCNRRRRVSWAELVGLLDSDLEPLFGAMLSQRVLIASKSHIELTSDGLIEAWDPLRQAVRAAGKRPGGPHGLWSRAVQWQESGCARSQLGSHDSELAKLFRSPTLNQLERAFVNASVMARQSLTAAGLASESRAVASLGSEWQRSALLAVAASESTLATQAMVTWLLAQSGPSSRERDEAEQLAREARSGSWYEAEQALHDVLAATPLGLPLSLPGEKAARSSITGLGFQDQQLLVRIVDHPRSDGQEPDSDDRGYVWDLKDLAQPPRLLTESGSLPKTGEGEVLPRRKPHENVIVLPAVTTGRLPAPPGHNPRAQTDYDTIVLFFAPKNTLYERIHHSMVPTSLLGHQGIPTFLTFAESGRWLASAANFAGGGCELRLWPIPEDWQLPGHPRTHLDCQFAAVLPVQQQAIRDHRLRAAELAHLPATVVGPGGTWQITSNATSNASNRCSVEIAKRATSQTMTVELQAHQDEPVAVDPHPPQPPFVPPRPPFAPPQPPFAPPPPPFVPPPPFAPEADLHPLPELVFSSDGHWLAAVTNDGRARLWSLPELTLKWSGGPPDHRITCLAFNPVADAEVPFAVGTDTGQPWFADRGGRPTGQPEAGPSARISTMVFSPDGKRLAIGYLDGTVQLWPALSGSTTGPVILRGRHLEGFAVRDLAFDQGGKRLVVRRAAVYEPYHSRVDLYHLDLDELVMLARGHAGRRGLEPEELPPNLRPALVDSGPETEVTDVTEEQKEEKAETETERYLAALSLRVCNQQPEAGSSTANDERTGSEEEDP